MLLIKKGPNSRMQRQTLKHKQQAVVELVPVHSSYVGVTRPCSMVYFFGCVLRRESNCIR
jgi:hypothetical protein